MENLSASPTTTILFGWETSPWYLWISPIPITLSYMTTICPLLKVRFVFNRDLTAFPLYTTFSVGSNIWTDRVLDCSLLDPPEQHPPIIRIWDLLIYTTPARLSGFQADGFRISTLVHLSTPNLYTSMEVSIWPLGLIPPKQKMPFGVEVSEHPDLATFRPPTSSHYIFFNTRTSTDRHLAS